MSGVDPAAAEGRPMPRAEAPALSQEALETWGERVGRAAALPLVLALRGPLGAGKSVLARAVGRGAGVRGPMPSPTFNLVFEYEGSRPGRRVRLVHLDLYRLEHPDEVWELGWRELGEGDDLVLIEWPERAEALLPAPRWDVHIEPVRGAPDLRTVRAVAVAQPGELPPPPAD